MAISLRELQLLTEAEFSIEDTRSDLGKLTDFFRSQEYHDAAIQIAYVNERKLPKEIAEKHKVFMVLEEFQILDIPEELRVEALGMVRGNRIIYAGRLVYPVMDVRGQVMGFCGWDKFEKPKYLDSHNHGYKAKDTTFYGMEMLPYTYNSNEPVYVVEGIVCCHYLRSQGLQAYALLGSSLTKYVLTIFRRIEKRLVFIPDNDIVGSTVDVINQKKPAGEHFVKQIKRELPKARIVQSVLAKDVDDTRLLNDGEFEKEFIEELKLVAMNPFFKFKTIRVR